MASFFFTQGVEKMVDHTVDILNDTVKLALVTSAYAADKDDEFMDDGAAAAEIAVSGYTGGHGGAGRKTLTVTLQSNLTDDRVDIAFNDQTWTTLGTGATIAAAVLFIEGTSDDTDAHLIGYFDLTDTPTNGGDITLDFLALGSGGNARIST